MTRLPQPRLWKPEITHKDETDNDVGAALFFATSNYFRSAKKHKEEWNITGPPDNPTVQNNYLKVNPYLVLYQRNKQNKRNKIITLLKWNTSTKPWPLLQTRLLSNFTCKIFLIWLPVPWTFYEIGIQMKSTFKYGDKFCLADTQQTSDNYPY
jgi:hypothetical protein